MLPLYFLVPFSFPPVLSSFFTFFAKYVTTPSVIRFLSAPPALWDRVLRLRSRVDSGLSAYSPSPCFCPVGWTKRTKPNDLPSPSPKLLTQWSSELTFLQPFKQVLKCLKVTETGQAHALLLVDTPKPARTSSSVFLPPWCPGRRVVVGARVEPPRLR